MTIKTIAVKTPKTRGNPLGFYFINEDEFNADVHEKFEGDIKLAATPTEPTLAPKIAEVTSEAALMGEIDAANAKAAEALSAAEAAKAELADALAKLAAAEAAAKK